jgi:hypothetical protein
MPGAWVSSPLRGPREVAGPENDEGSGHDRECLNLQNEAGPE